MGGEVWFIGRWVVRHWRPTNSKVTRANELPIKSPMARAIPHQISTGVEGVAQLFADKHSNQPISTCYFFIISIQNAFIQRISHINGYLCTEREKVQVNFGSY